MRRLGLLSGLAVLSGASGCAMAPGEGANVRDGGGGAEMRVPGTVPAEDEIFAVTMWDGASVDHRALRAAAPLLPKAQHDGEHDRIPWTEQAADSPWVVIRSRDEYWTARHKITEDDVRAMLRDYQQMTREEWRMFSHVAGGDVSGWLILKDGSCVQWMMKPGGLGWLRFADGRTVYLSMTEH